MSDATTFVELDELHVELLPARIVLSLLNVADPGAPGDPNGPDKPCPHDASGKPLVCHVNAGDGSTPIVTV